MFEKNKLCHILVLSVAITVLSLFTLSYVTNSDTASAAGTIDSTNSAITNTDHNSKTVVATEDSWTHFSEPDTNFDKTGALIVKYHYDVYGGKDNRKAWLKFKIPADPPKVTHATLRLYLTAFEATNSTVNVYRENNNNWSEKLITFNNEPAHFASLSAGPFAEQTMNSVNQYYDFDVTNAIVSSPDGKIITLVLVGNSLNNGAVFSDLASANPPELVVSR